MAAGSLWRASGCMQAAGGLSACFHPLAEESACACLQGMLTRALCREPLERVSARVAVFNQRAS